MTAAEQPAPLAPREDAAGDLTEPRNTALRAARNAAIAAARARGEPWRVIAARYGLSERQARRARDDHVTARAGALTPLADPNLALADAIEVHQEVVREARRLAREAGNDNAAVGALRVQAEASRKLLDLLAWGGLVPDTAATWRSVRDIQRIAQALGAICTDYGIPIGEVLERFESIDGVQRALGVGADT